MSDEMTAREYMDSGDDWTSRVSRLTLPILIWVAKQGKTITYKQLAAELQSRHGEEIKRRMTLYGRPAGKIGYALIQLSDEWDEGVPPINALVVNAQSGLPGKGANDFIVKFLNRKARRRLTDSNRSALAEEAIQSVWDYPDWDQVAKEFGITKKQLLPVQELLSARPDDAPIVMPPVKPVRGGQGEIFRGIFQCVKYRATLRAMQLAAGEATNAQAVLLTTAKIPDEAVRLAKRVRVVILTAPVAAEKS